MIWGLTAPIAVEVYQGLGDGMSFRELAIGDIWSIGQRGAIELKGKRYVPLVYYGLTKSNNQVITARPRNNQKWYVVLTNNNEIAYYQTEMENGRLALGKQVKKHLQDIRETSAAAPQKEYKDLSVDQLKKLADVGDTEAKEVLQKRSGKEEGNPESQAPTGGGLFPPIGPGINIIPPKLPDLKNLLIAGLILIFASGVILTDKK